ncbi:Sas10/Utp3/C1D family protein [Aspergillus candidus]|uniref:Exosome complex protein n=1 Tax=Aspergillus candidus TaxID=41067 RepID=A0A2I2FF75_ASPCN|nr:Sas10/Utp3/C1D family-domain-containing protein [Aspergillus candidus]PLB39277.1 Sas10/Utp3/C1D family-domain-containing protein [Aspergillus candidus]
METADLLPLLEQLDDNIDDLEESLQPILNGSVLEASKNLPVLDKAKFHVLVTYALESLIFSYLRLHGVNAKDHPVFRELTRVKQYFEKIKSLETEPEQRTMRLDKEAAGRFIKHGLAGNEKLDMARKEQEAKERARAQLKAKLLAKKMATTSDNSPSNPAGDSDEDSDEASAPDDVSAPSGDSKSEKKKTTKEGKGKEESDGDKPSKSKRKNGTKEEQTQKKKDRRKRKSDKRKAARKEK